MPLDSTVFLARLILGGVLERVPDMKMCVMHGCGNDTMLYEPYELAILVQHTEPITSCWARTTRTTWVRTTP